MDWANTFYNRINNDTDRALYIAHLKSESCIDGNDSLMQLIDHVIEEVQVCAIDYRHTNNNNVIAYELPASRPPYNKGDISYLSINHATNKLKVLTAQQWDDL